MSEPVIHAHDLGKKYRLERERPLLIKELLRLSAGRRVDAFWALRDVEFAIETGEVVGFIGANGAGKSTLLKLLCGVTPPTTGALTVHGRVGALLELSSGFHPDLTGRENVYLNGAILGIARDIITERFDNIVAYAELEEFIDAPVRTYSSGMYVRLGFSIAIHMNPDILIIDEVLAVGDQRFQDKCIRTLDDFRRRGITILLVSHDLDLVAQVCERAYWLDTGRIAAVGTPNAVIDSYLRSLPGADTAIVQNEHVRIHVSAGKIIVFYNGLEVTRNLCAHTSIFSEDRWHGSPDADWTVQTQTAGTIELVGKWRSIQAEQRWTVRLEGDSVVWSVNMTGAPYPAPDGLACTLMISPEYTSWGRAHTPFPDAYSDGYWERVYQTVQGERVLTVHSDAPALPDISFTAVNDKEKFIGSIFNTSRDIRARALQFEDATLLSGTLSAGPRRFVGAIRLKPSDENAA